MEISKMSGLWSNTKKYKVLTTSHSHYVFKKESVFSEHVQPCFEHEYAVMWQYIAM